MKNYLKVIAEAIKYFVIFDNIKRKHVLENDCQGTTSSKLKLEPEATDQKAKVGNGAMI